MADDEGVEVLDLGTVETAPEPARAQTGARRAPSRRTLLTLGVLAAGGAAAAAARASSGPAASRNPPPPDQVAVVGLGRPLLGGPRVDVYGFTQRELVRVELATGRVTRTGLAGLEHTTLDVVPVRGGALVHGGEDGTSWFVRNGRPPAPVAAGLATPGPMLPGPDPAHVWVMSGRDPNSPLRLVGLDGRTVRSGVGVSAQLTSYPVPDGGGYPLFFGVGGTYGVGPGEVQRVTPGVVLAGGPTGWLALECDEASTCGTVLVGRGGGRRPVRLAPPGTTGVSTTVVGGSLSPDGRRGALFVGDPTRALRLLLVDLRTAARVSTGVVLAPGGAVRSPQWSPDGRLVFSVDDAGRIVAVDAATGATVLLVPGAVLPALEDVVVGA